MHFGTWAIIIIIRTGMRSKTAAIKFFQLFKKAVSTVPVPVTVK